MRSCIIIKVPRGQGTSMRSCIIIAVIITANDRDLENCGFMGKQWSLREGGGVGFSKIPKKALESLLEGLRKFQVRILAERVGKSGAEQTQSEHVDGKARDQKTPRKSRRGIHTLYSSIHATSQ